jgi:hypothetical protein
MHLRMLELVKCCRSCSLARVLIADLNLRAYTSYTYRLVEWKLKKAEFKAILIRPSSGQSVSFVN